MTFLKAAAALLGAVAFCAGAQAQEYSFRF